MMTIGIAPPASAKTLKLRIEMVSLHRPQGYTRILQPALLHLGVLSFGARREVVETIRSNRSLLDRLRPEPA